MSHITKIKVEIKDLEVLKDAVEKKRPAMIEVVVARNEEVLPMVPNGHALNEMTLIEGGK